jgi:hypothetical protein
MKSLAYNKSAQSSDLQEYIQLVYTCVSENVNYFKLFNGEHWEEAVSKTISHMLQHEKPEFKDLAPYVKNLARNILRTRDRQKEDVCDLFTLDGEVSYPFLHYVSASADSLSEQENIDHIKDILTSFYLLYKKEFDVLRNLLVKGTLKGDVSRKLIIKNEMLKTQFTRLLSSYGSHYVLEALASLFVDIDAEKSVIAGSSVRDIYFKPPQYQLVARIPDKPTIQSDKGVHKIDRRTLKMDVDIDVIAWQPISKITGSLIQVDITPLLAYVYEHVFVSKGVNTCFIQWCGEQYRLTTPAGTEVLNMEQFQFMDLVHREIVLNFINGGINTIIAASDDNVYVRTATVCRYNILRCHLYNKKIIDLPVAIIKQ